MGNIQNLYHNTSFTSDNNGNVGIGTDSPGAKLEVQGTNTAGDLALSNSSTTVSSGDILGKLAFRNYDGSINFSTFSGEVASIRAVAAVDFTGTNGANTDLLFYTNSVSPADGSPVSGGSEKMRILANGNVGIGTTSPSATFSVANTTIINSNGTGGWGSSANYGFFTWDGGTVNAAIMKGQNGKNFHLGASNRNNDLTIKTTGDIGIGIGDASPTAKLEIYNSGGTVLNVTGSQGQLFSVTDDLSGSIFAVADISGVPIFDVNSSGVSYFDGTVGIGESAPDELLHIKGDADVYAKIEYTGNGSNTPADHAGLILSHGRSTWYLHNKYSAGSGVVGSFSIADTGGTNALVILSTANNHVGIGTDNPSQKLDVVGNLEINGTSYLNGNVDILYRFGNKGTNQGIQFEAPTTALQTSRIDSDALSFYFGGTSGTGEVMRMKENGEVGINETNPSATLHLTALSSSGVPFKLVGDSATTTVQQLIRTEQYSTSITAWYNIVCEAKNSSNNIVSTFIVERDGDVKNANNVYGQISDIRLKENILDATPKLEDIKKLKVKNFNFIGDELKQIGLIAQEVEEIFPGLVKEDVQPGPDGTKGGVYKSVKYSIFVPMIIKAMQEQQEIIEDLKTRLTKLEN